MCLIIDRPAGIPIDLALLERGLKDNPHGWGIMRSHKGSLETVRGMDDKAFRKAFDALGQSACSIHFRWATHGTMDVDNCHPFPILGGRYALMHNGIVSAPVIDASKSDTWHFAEYVLEPILASRPDAFGTEPFKATVESLIGKSNKMVLLRHDGARMILNEGQGSTVGGLWLSNEYSLPTPRREWKTVARWSGVNRMSDDEFFDWSRGGEDTAARPAKDADETYWDLDCLKDCTEGEIAEFCWADPDAVAAMIHDHLHYSAR